MSLRSSDGTPPSPRRKRSGHWGQKTTSRSYRCIMAAPFAQSCRTPLYSSSVDNNNNHTASTARENDLFRNPYATLPPRKRKLRPSPTDRAVRMAMKGVLLSPLVVILVWTSSHVLFRSKSAASSSSRRNGNPRTRKSAATRHVPVYAPLGNSRIVQPAQFQAVQQDIQAPLLYMQQQQQLQMQQQQQQQLQMPPPQPMLLQQQPGLPQQAQPVLQQQQPQQFLQQQQPFLQQQQIPSLQQQQPQALQQQQPPALQQQQPQALQQQQPALQQTTPQVQPILPPPAGSPPQNPKTVIYYYDPAQAVQSNGGLQPPPIVYNSMGQAIPLESLKAREVLMEPPPVTMIHHNITANPNSTANVNYTHPTVITERFHKSQMAAPAMASVLTDYRPVASTDQSIIVATVGIMALLVGALSARRLRARSLLAACIENESLHSEAAFDTAYTATTDAHSYHTFSWKQDLEKFDV